jgi:integrase
MATIERYETKSGATLYRVRYRTPEGRQTDKRGFETKRDAQAFAEDVEVSKRHNAYVAPSDRRRTIGELGTAWLARQGHAKPSTLHAYESGWRVHVEPRWGGVPISRICHSDVQAWVSGFGRASVVGCAYGILKRILDDAVADRMLTSNPAHGVKLPAKSRREHVYLTAEQLGRLADESGTYRSLVLLLGTVGLRWGEAAALRVRDIDFLRRRIALHENAVSIGAKTYVGTLKGWREPRRHRAVICHR